MPDKKPETTEAETTKRTGYFSELVTLEEAKVNPDNKSVRVTLIRPGWSLNGRYYPREVLGEAARLFEGGKAYADHPGRQDSKNRPERSINDIVGWYEDVKQEADGRLTATLNVVKEGVWPIIQAAVERNPNLAGVSINALGDTSQGVREGRKGIVVEAIVKHNSTDIVTTPAAGGKFDQLIAADSDEWTTDLIKAMGLDQLAETLREVRPDLVKSWQKEWKAPRETEALKAARAEVESLKTQLAEAQKQHRTAAEKLAEANTALANERRTSTVDRLLGKSKLPEEWRAELRARLLEAPDEKAMTAIIEGEIRKAASVPRPLTVRGAGASVAPSTTVVSRGGGMVATVAESLGSVSTARDLVNAANFEEYKRIKKQKGL